MASSRSRHDAADRGAKAVGDGFCASNSTSWSSLQKKNLAQTKINSETAARQFENTTFHCRMCSPSNAPSHPISITCSREDVVETESFVLRKLCRWMMMYVETFPSPPSSHVCRFLKVSRYGSSSKCRLTHFTNDSKAKDRLARTPSKFTRVCSGERVGEEGWRFHGTIYAKRIRLGKHCRDHLHAHGTFHESFQNLPSKLDQSECGDPTCAMCDVPCGENDVSRLGGQSREPSACLARFKRRCNVLPFQ